MAFPPPPPPQPTRSTTPLSKWEELIQQMLPAGAPLPDEDHLDYTISVEYQGPHPLSDKMLYQHRPHNSSSPIPVFPKPFAKFNSSFRNHKNRSSFSPKKTINLLPDVNIRKEEHHSSNWDDDNSDVNIKSILSHSLSSLSDLNQICNEKIKDDFSIDNLTPKDSNSTKKKIKCCTRCGKCGERFRLMRDKGEICIVCNSMYCRYCIIKCMGPMPEGRKCLGCIGRPIDEASRERLGKCSRVLATICSSVEVRQIMKSERESLTNQIRPEQVVVNGWPLRPEELKELIGCGDPPEYLRPGRYWYDKNSGFWGKEGKKPDKIISAKLNVGGKLLVDASNGNTKVYFNGREVTKVELKVLKLARVQCPRGTHFWLYEDGSYEEEGQNNIKGNIWGKAFSRWIFSLYSFPIPPRDPVGQRECQTTLSARSSPVCLDQIKVQTILLVGLEGSGTSTIFNQVKFMYGGEFSEEELQAIRIRIRRNLYIYLAALLEVLDQFEDDVFGVETSCFATSGENIHRAKGQGSNMMNPIFKDFSDIMMDIMSGNVMDSFFDEAVCKYASIVDEVWRDPYIQETYKMREELQCFPEIVKYFLDRAFEILSDEYKPSEQDILYAEGVTPTNGLSFFEFTPKDHCSISQNHDEFSDVQVPLPKFQLNRISSKRLVSGCKWVDMLHSFGVVAFCVALDDYDKVIVNNDTGCIENRILASKVLFESLVKHPCFKDTSFVLLLNKYDAFEEKIKMIPLTACEWFHDFNPFISSKSQQSPAQQAYYYIAIRFKQLYTSITGTKLFVWPTRAHDRDSVEEAFRYVREIIKWNDENCIYRGHDDDDDDDNSVSSTNKSFFHVRDSIKLKKRML